MWNESRSTWNAGISDFEVGLEFRITSGCLFEQWIWNSQRALASSGAAHRHNVDDVSVASNEPEIRSDAASDAHATIARLPNHYHAAVSAICFEYLRQTVILRICNDLQNTRDLYDVGRHSFQLTDTCS